MEFSRGCMTCNEVISLMVSGQCACILNFFVLISNIVNIDR